jgi:hypothetical protein
MGLKVTNNAFGTLNASINSSATTIVLVAGQGARFPTLSAGDYFYATLIDTSNNLEIVKCTARSTDTLTVVRAQDSTTARAYTTNDRFELRPTAALFNEKANDADVVATYLAKAGGDMSGDLRIGTSFGTTNPTNTSSNIKKLDLDETFWEVTGAFVHGDSRQAKISLYRLSDNDHYGMGVSSSSLNIFSPANIRLFTGATNPRTERLTISEPGHVRTPAQPTFCGYHSASETPISGGVFTQWVTATNLGGGTFSSGVYTVPSTGVYLISGALLMSNNTAGGVYLKVNGINQLRLFYCGIATALTYMMGSGEIILSLSSGDTVSLAQENGTVSWYGDSPGLGSFCVRMLG